MAVTVRREPQDTARKILELNAAIIEHETNLKALRQVRRKYVRIMKLCERAARGRKCN